MRETAEIHESLIGRLEENLKNEVKPGSMLDMFAYSYAQESEAMYQEIEDNKNPYLFTNTWGEDLDALGYWVNLTRQDGEDDNTYKYRLKAGSSPQKRLIRKRSPIPYWIWNMPVT